MLLSLEYDNVGFWIAHKSRLRSSEYNIVLLLSPFLVVYLHFMISSCMTSDRDAVFEIFSWKTIETFSWMVLDLAYLSLLLLCKAHHSFNLKLVVSLVCLSDVELLKFRAINCRISGHSFASRSVWMVPFVSMRLVRTCKHWAIC